MGRRTKYEIWVEILEVCLNQPRTQSWILRDLRLKTEHVKNSLQFLIDRELNRGFGRNTDILGWLVCY